MPPPNASAPAANSVTTCEACGATFKRGKKFCGACGAQVKTSVLSSPQAPKINLGGRWPVGWEPPLMRMLSPPPPPAASRIFRLSVGPLRSKAGITLAGRFGRALLLVGLGLIIVPWLDLSFLGAAQTAIGLAVGGIGIVLAILGWAMRSAKPVPIPTAHQLPSNPPSLPAPHATGPTTGLAQLTELEQRILSFIVQGHSDQQIAQALSMPISILNQQIFSIKRKSGRFDRAQLITWAAEQGVGVTRGK